LLAVGVTAGAKNRFSRKPAGIEMWGAPAMTDLAVQMRRQSSEAHFLQLDRDCAAKICLAALSWQISVTSAHTGLSIFSTRTADFLGV
jgi:hypothetical protein